jgi:GNAT superfamily N-acetyltransferase
MVVELGLVEIASVEDASTRRDWLRRAEPVHRQLRDRMPIDYCGRIEQVVAGGARMSLAIEGEAVVGVAVWRVIENTYEGRRLYVDDLVTDAAARSRGIGRYLLASLEERARRLDCQVLALDSGTQRERAHCFYFRFGMTIPSFCFRKNLT